MYIKGFRRKRMSFRAWKRARRYYKNVNMGEGVDKNSKL